jgi:isopropylmalate/homocitrate/citramalate synthase
MCDATPRDGKPGAETSLIIFESSFRAEYLVRQGADVIEAGFPSVSGNDSTPVNVGTRVGHVEGIDNILDFRHKKGEGAHEGD